MEPTVLGQLKSTRFLQTAFYIIIILYYIFIVVFVLYQWLISNLFILLLFYRSYATTFIS
jgi:hypothetical protein